MNYLLTNRIAKKAITVTGLLFLAFNTNAQPLSGTYTIDPALPSGTSNFISFNSAVSSLASNGIGGSVIFNIAPGVYNEQVIIPVINGTSASQTVVFNANGVTLQHNASDPNERAVLKLNGADYITINRLNVLAGDTASADYGYGIQLLNDADHNVINNCSVVVPMVYGPFNPADYAGIVINSDPSGIVTQGTTDCDYNEIENCFVKGGYHGIAMVAKGSDAMIYNNRITGNEIVDFYNAGIYLDGNNGAIVKDNNISRPARTTGALFYGIQLNNTSYNTVVSGNKIHDPFGGSATYVSSGANGIYFSNVNATEGQENHCFNNLIYNIKAGSVVRGIWISNSPYNKFSFNTLSLDDAAFTGFAATTGFEITSSNNLTIQNNIVSMKRVGSSFITRYGINAASVNGSMIRNNDVYIAPGSTLYFGRYGSQNCTDLAQWTSNSGDNTSIDDDPAFTDPLMEDFTPTNSALASGIASDITTDISGLARNTVPTMGAFEINGVELPVRMSTLSGKVLRNLEANLFWTTYSEQANKGFEVQRSPDSKNWETIVFIASKGTEGNDYSYNDPKPLNGRTYYRLIQMDDNSARTYLNTIWLSNKANSDLNLNIYPNPATMFLNITINNTESKNYTISVTNTLGQVVKNATINSNTQKLIITDLPAGRYYLSLYADGQLFSAPFVKQ